MASAGWGIVRPDIRKFIPAPFRRRRAAEDIQNLCATLPGVHRVRATTMAAFNHFDALALGDWLQPSNDARRLRERSRWISREGDFRTLARRLRFCGP